MHISEAHPKTRSKVRQEIPANYPTEAGFGKTSSEYEAITSSGNPYKYTVDDGTVRPDDTAVSCDVCPDIGGLHGSNVSKTNNPVDSDCFILATALAAATIAQLQLGSEDAAVQKVSAAMMETECMRLRYQYNYRNIPSVYNVLASFFLHVYHAKRNNRNAAMMHLQEAISIARILKIDRAKNNLTSCQLIHILLWVSERGYSMQHGMTPSICETPCVQSIDDCCYDAHQKGLLDLAQLFAAFDTELLQRTGQNSSALPPHLQETWHMETRKRLIRANEKLTRYKIRRKNWDLVQCADFYITRSWMRILLWQQAVRCGLLSSHASIESMTLMFPCIVARDLLESFTVMSRDHLVPLGRDQVVKSFEVTNTLADVLLCSLNCIDRGDTVLSGGNNSQALQFLHVLVDATSPFLVADKDLDEMLRRKLNQVVTASSFGTIPRTILVNDDEQFAASEVSKASNMAGLQFEPFEKE
ncbi:hypothetical protein NQ176_g4590 [Zarea fungicola]|uniref:Uncharacterized protein n=1 Tax=Zarea fungicola TaxID=93591 RepID=A0ACC1NDY4_9HYPO|nr:hypothetical protein NQ176_g4590 [Lecanicillium fungicola]